MREIGTALEEQLLHRGYTIISPPINDYHIAQYTSDVIKELRTLRIKERGDIDPDFRQILLSHDTEYYAKLLHPQIPAFKDSFFIDQFHVTVKENIPNSILICDALSQGKKITTEKGARKALEDLLLVLSHAHTHHIIHGKVCPDCIFISPGWQASLDFYPEWSKGTISDDLSGVGYVLLEAALGDQYPGMIQALRPPRKPKDLFPYSTKFNLLWQKLTQEQRGFRYQYAKQVYDDLQKLDQSDEQELQLRLRIEMRHPVMHRILETLSRQDPYFAYSVNPAQYGPVLDDQEMLAHLKKVYAPSDFEIDDEEAIRKYLRVGDRVLKRGTLSDSRRRIDTDEQGILLSAEKNTAQVLFKGKCTLDISLPELEITGKQDFGTIGIIPIRADMFSFEPQVQYVVRYKGGTKYMGEAVLDKTQGLVFSVDPIYIVWQQNQQTTQTLSRKLFGGVVSRKYRPAELVLLRENKVDFEKVYANCVKQD